MRSPDEIAAEMRVTVMSRQPFAALEVWQPDFAGAITEARLDVVRRLREMAKGHPDRVYGTIAMAELRALSFAADQLEADIRKAGG